MGNNLVFRSWHYFRTGWSTYFAFIFAAINTLTVTYYLAIERAPFLNSIFPTFSNYVLIICTIGIPLLVIIGYTHYKRSRAYESESSVIIESNPFSLRRTVNSEIMLVLMLKLIEVTTKISNNEKISEEDQKHISQLHSKILNLLDERNFTNKKDLEFFRKMDTELGKKSKIL